MRSAAPSGRLTCQAVASSHAIPRAPKACRALRKLASRRMQRAPGRGVRRAPPLELALLARALAVRLDALHEPQAGFLDHLLGVVLLLRGLLVLALQALQELLELSVRLLHLRLLLLDLGLEIAGWHLHEALDLLLVLGVAEVHVRGTAARPQIVLRKLLQLVVVPASFVILQAVGIPMLDGREALHANLLAQVLAASGAVHVRDKNALVTSVLLHQLVPRGLHALAMASPRRQELNEDGLAGGLLIPVLLGELRGSHLPSERRNNGDRTNRHDGADVRGRRGVASSGALNNPIGLSLNGLS